MHTNLIDTPVVMDIVESFINYATLRGPPYFLYLVISGKTHFISNENLSFIKKEESLTNMFFNYEFSMASLLLVVTINKYNSNEGRGLIEFQ